ncbi:hypothetical protein ASG38_05540 [Flavobacterium sp. Leaf359]|uniref:hypothetical protein n=1 Tax=Flavobacterium sp. Leaf359 TaxID=1736351 RepID=UPI0006FEFDFE|nr:hypothetical protein [Flavobacterium sp. Leaf359]KQS48602.1 hypothetical protein ASG38_05540 [Flavobacterium sp. Leaf359]
MATKSFTVITTLSVTVTFIAVVLGFIGVVISEMYPGFIILFLLMLIAIGSKRYAKKNSDKHNNFQGNYYTILTILNLLIILVTLWMKFVITHDRILQDS